MDGEIIRRGDVYWVSVDGSVGCETRTGRVGVILSGDTNNQKSGTVIIAYMTRIVDKIHATRVKVTLNGDTSVVLCDQLRTVDKTRFGKYMGRLSSADMARVSGAVAVSVCLAPPQKTQNEETDTEEPSEITSLKLELDVMKGLYEKALSQLVEMRLEADLRERTRVAVVEESAIEDPYLGDPPVEDADEEEDEEDEDEEEVAEEAVVRKLNINTATAHEIALALGCNITYAYCITGYRNKNGKFVSLDEVDDIKYLSKPMREKVKSICVIDDEEEVEESEDVGEVVSEETPTVLEETPTIEDKNYRLNINSASLRELMIVGFTKRVASLMVGNRKKFGNFKSVDDLKEIPEISNKTLRKLKDVLFVG